MQQLHNTPEHGDDGLARAGKRALDLLIATPLLLVVLPVIVLAAVGSALVLRAWPFFTQDRVGRAGQPFTVVKIRTLPLATPRYCAKPDLDHAQVPQFASWLRRLHLDELPQLLMVVSGHMSLVGPRPEMELLHTTMDPAVAAERTQVRPGCTGLWQISTASAGLIHETPEYDRVYVRHRSLRLDLWVLLKTVGVMLLGRPKIELSDVPAWVQQQAESRRADRVRLPAVVD